MHEVLVNRLGGLSLPRESVGRLTDRPDMTLDVYRGRKNKTTNKFSVLNWMGQPSKMRCYVWSFAFLTPPLRCLRFFYYYFIYLFFVKGCYLTVSVFFYFLYWPLSVLGISFYSKNSYIYIYMRYQNFGM